MDNKDLSNRLETLEGFMELEKGWDSYQGKMISESAIFLAAILCYEIDAKQDTEPIFLPFFAPCASGCIYCEWETENKKIIAFIPISPDSSWELYYRDSDITEHRELYTLDEVYKRVNIWLTK